VATETATTAIGTSFLHTYNKQLQYQTKLRQNFNNI